jgi:hypothetical protein
MQDEMIIPYELTDQCNQPNDKPKLPIKIFGNGGQLFIGFEGYGEQNADADNSTPVIIEVWDGKLRVIVFGDINNEDPTHTIELEGARESNRKEIEAEERRQAIAEAIHDEDAGSLDHDHSLDG